MGSLVDRQIVQTRIWYDGNESKTPNYNYSESYPKTVFDAIREDINDTSSRTLTETLKAFETSLNNKQEKIPAKSAEYIMTYGGAEGAIGSIRISNVIPWDRTKLSSVKIPTEKAVGELLYTLGFVDDNGNLVDLATSILWGDIIGRPNAYDKLGNRDDGFVNQKALTIEFNRIKDRLELIEESSTNSNDSLIDSINDHADDKNNPHNVTHDQIGAVSIAEFNDHLSDTDNPHNVTKDQVGLSNVDNTSDADKPVSDATQKVLDAIQTLLGSQSDSLTSLSYITNIIYSETTGKLSVYRNDSSVSYVSIPIQGLVDEIKYDHTDNTLTYTEFAGFSKTFDLSHLYIRYIPNDSNNIEFTLDGDQSSGDQYITANIIEQSITSNEIASSAIESRTIASSAVTSAKINDAAVTNSKLGEGSVRGSKIAEAAIETSHLNNRAVTGDKLFTSTNESNVMLIVEGVYSSPVWSKITSNLLPDNVILNNHLSDDCVTSSKILNKQIGSDHIIDESITSELIAAGSVLSTHIGEGEIDTANIKTDIMLPGSPTIESAPVEDSYDSSIPDTKWVTDKIDSADVNVNNIADRSIDGRLLFSTNQIPRVLVVDEKNADPYWGLIEKLMIADDAICTSHIINRNVTSEKIALEAILEEHLGYMCISNEKLQENSVSLRNLEKYSKAFYMLGTIHDNTVPEYTKVYGDHIADKTITGDKIISNTIDADKIKSSDDTFMVLGTTNKYNDTAWVKIVNDMISDRSIDGRTFATSIFDNMVWAVVTAGTDPTWTSITGDMFGDNSIHGDKILDNSLSGDKLLDNSIDGSKLIPGSITASSVIDDHSIDASKLFRSEYANRVLAVGDKQYSDAEWLQVTTDMIEDKAVTREKIFTAKSGNRVLGVTEVDEPPEYLMITSDFIVDNSILPQDLIFDFTLLGTPNLTVSPPDYSNDTSLANTAWVRANTWHPDTADDQSIDPSLIKSSEFAPRVLGINKSNDNVNFIMIERGHIKDNEITTEKLQKSIELTGEPTLENRPPDDACDDNGNGTLIPDCEWVRRLIDERISELPSIYYAPISATAIPSEIDSNGGDVCIEIQFSNEKFLPLYGFPTTP